MRRAPTLRRWATAAIALSAVAGVARADTGGVIDPGQALAASERALGRLVSDHAFTDSHGGAFQLAAARGKPLVINLVYTSCYHTCPMIVQNLGRAVAAARQALGDDSFAVATIGFDVAADTPARMRSFARSHGVGGRDWRFLSADAETIARLTSEVGFVFAPSPKGFDHLAQVTILDGAGRVYRQVYGDDFAIPAVIEPLKQLVLGPAELASVGGWIKKVKFLCTVYDPMQDRYRFSYSIFIGIAGGALTMFGIGFVVVRAWLRQPAA
jgi:protein SCO1